jgi:hypothetical protein
VCDNATVASVTAPSGVEGAHPLVVSRSAGDPKDPAAAVVTEVRRIADGCRACSYSHDPVVDEASGRYELDCSSFANYVLGNATPSHFLALAGAPDARPLARDYAAFFASLSPRDASGRWQRVERPIDLVPGDVVAWTLDQEKNAGDTGHVLFVVDTPFANPDRRDEVLITTGDSTWHPHGSIDPRAKSGRGGVGVGGLLGLVVDGQGHVAGYRWNGGCGPDQSSPTLAMAHPTTP